jgi:hypothetical protein
MASWLHLSQASVWFVYLGKSSIDGLKATSAASWEVYHELRFNNPERQASDLIFHSEELAFPYCIELREENEK